ncbi:hypothetical protein MBOT_32180 [Mycobacterium botniense]|uniref:Uncharacterized protein n=1 Tax=Mycobacterium botniense TaxID=84962 RepID=A0A7I9Y1V4_9MYCO|nr:hypothetical protein MBOT_32180 [Mycobacterium botniense]
MVESPCPCRESIAPYPPVRPVSGDMVAVTRTVDLPEVTVDALQPSPELAQAARGLGAAAAMVTGSVLAAPSPGVETVG